VILSFSLILLFFLLHVFKERSQWFRKNGERIVEQSHIHSLARLCFLPSLYIYCVTGFIVFCRYVSAGGRCICSSPTQPECHTYDKTWPLLLHRSFSGDNGNRSRLPCGTVYHCQPRDHVITWTPLTLSTKASMVYGLDGMGYTWTHWTHAVTIM